MIKKKITIINKLGLHARAAAKFVKIVSSYSSDVNIEFANHKINGKSIMGVMMLAAGKGAEIYIYVSGDDEKEAMIAIEALVNDKFGEEE